MIRTNQLTLKRLSFPSRAGVAADAQKCLAMFSLLVLLAAGCATPDPAGVERARETVAAARDGGLVDSDSLDFREAERHLAEAEALLEDNGDQSLIDHQSEMADLYAQVAVGRTEAIAARLESEAYMDQARASTLTTRVAVEVAIMNAQAIDAKQTGRGLVLTLGGVLFGLNSDALTSEARLSVARVAGFLIALGNRDALVEGHADSSGGEEHNLELSKRRAQSIQAALVEFGVAEDRMASEGYGALFPVADNATREGRERNRRVEIVILKPGLSAADARR
jgi:outer membrane protein OmpA-like peptidoglycan-associated protein